MAKKQPPTRIVAVPRYDLPEDFLQEIGRLMVRWAYFENSLRRGIWEIMAIDERMGRIAARDPRIDDRLEMLLDLAFLRKIKIDEERIRLLISRANEVLAMRDLLAHGVWVHADHGWLVQSISGKYPKDAISEHRKRRIAPEGINVDMEGLCTITEAAEMLIETAAEVRKEVLEKLRQLPEIDPAR